MIEATLRSITPREKDGVTYYNCVFDRGTLSFADKFDKDWATKAFEFLSARVGQVVKIEVKDDKYIKAIDGVAKARSGGGGISIDTAPIAQAMRYAADQHRAGLAEIARAIEGLGTSTPGAHPAAGPADVQRSGDVPNVEAPADNGDGIAEPPPVSGTPAATTASASTSSLAQPPPSETVTPGADSEALSAPGVTPSADGAPAGIPDVIAVALARKLPDKKWPTRARFMRDRMKDLGYQAIPTEGMPLLTLVGAINE